MAYNHQGIIHQCKSTDYFSRFNIYSECGQIAMIYTFLHFMMKEIIQFVNATRKRRQLFIVCVSH